MRSLAPTALFTTLTARPMQEPIDYCSTQFIITTIELMMLQTRIPLSTLSTLSTLSARDCHVSGLANTFCGLSVSAKHIPRNIAQSLPSRSQSHTQLRYASHAAQGRANGPKDSAGRRLGAKKTASEYVIPGNIIFKQRGKNDHRTTWSIQEHLTDRSLDRY